MQQEQKKYTFVVFKSPRRLIISNSEVGTGNSGENIIVHSRRTSDYYLCYGTESQVSQWTKARMSEGFDFDDYYEPSASFDVNLHKDVLIHL
jgi:hypothetical protein